MVAVQIKRVKTLIDAYKELVPRPAPLTIFSTGVNGGLHRLLHAKLSPQPYAHLAIDWSATHLEYMKSGGICWLPVMRRMEPGEVTMASLGAAASTNL